MLQQSLKYGNTFCAVEHTSSLDVKENLRFLQLKKKKKELIIESKGHFSSLAALLPSLQLQKHLFLVVNNQQVLFKKINEIESRQETIVKKAFPSIKLNDFYYEVLQYESHSFVAICRKEYVDHLIQQYESNGISIVDFSLHNLSIQQIVPFINQNEISTSNATISITDHAVLEIQSQAIKESEYLINNIKVTNEYVLPLAGIISYVTGYKNNQLGFGELQNKLQQKQFHKRFFQLSLKVVLGSLFLILLINFMVFSSHRSEINQLDSKLAINTNYKSTLLRLQNSVFKKEKLVKSITSLSSSKTSWYINEIGESTPKSLLLTALNYQPLLKPLRKDKEVLINIHRITVKGISKNNADFTKWIALLKEKKWIKSITILAFGKGKSTTTSFEYQITFTDN